MKLENKKLLAVIRYMLTIHLSGIAIFSLFRIALYLVNLKYVSDVADKTELLLGALLKGLQFDNWIASFISFIPLVVLSVVALLAKIPRTLLAGCNLFFVLLYSLTFVVEAADIPYFSYFFAHPGVSALKWFEYGAETTGMIFGERAYYPYMAAIPATIVIFSIVVFRAGRRLYDSQTIPTTKTNYFSGSLVALIVWMLCFAGMRGSFQRYPLRTGYAFFSDNAFFNRLGLNPVFVFVKSLEESSKRYNGVNDLTSLDDAMDAVRKELKPTVESGYSLDRERRAEGTSKRANVVVILMESMSVERLGYRYKGKLLTPFLNELTAKSYSFENFFSSGVHTNNGIVSSLYGFPTLFDKPSIETNNARYTGLPYFLKRQGYRNLFFVTGNPNYDQMNAFLSDNHFDRIYSLYDYPAEKVVNNFGVQDDYLFEYGIERLDEIAAEGHPFLATFLTVSVHPPIVVPKQFENAGDTDEQQILAFADNAMKDFMENAAKRKWYENTIFVFVADHGIVVGRYEMPLNHIPCIIHSPTFEDAPRRFHGFGGQIDLFPTIMGLLNMSYVNNSPGIDLLKESRSHMFFANDHQLGCIDERYFYVRNLAENMDFLYALDDGTDNAATEAQPESEKLEIMRKMKSYAVSMTVVSDYLMKNNQIRLVEE